MADDDAIEITPSWAIGHAARLLLNAEMITDLALMKRLIELADSWITIAHLLAEPDE
ncbi:hypothetical protein [Streptomyces sp. NPDC093261]|uniref:hypothetical protein n=1 Tax=Streptomyces sp. NPDC093261 TaxID=3366037 RepID=UPI0037FB4B9E